MRIARCKSGLCIARLRSLHGRSHSLSPHALQWLHPDKFKTRLCTEGQACKRRVSGHPTWARTPAWLSGQDVWMDHVHE